jgi:hypothetical protein
MDATKGPAGIIRAVDRARSADDESLVRIEDRNGREILGCPGIVFWCEGGFGTSRLRKEC